MQAPVLALVFAASVALSTPAWALRCPHGLVSEGDHKAEVLDACGEPEFADRIVEFPRRVVDRGGFPTVQYLDIPIVVDEWVYDLGSERFRRLLRFRANRLIHIEALDKPR